MATDWEPPPPDDPELVKSIEHWRSQQLQVRPTDRRREPSAAAAAAAFRVPIGRKLTCDPTRDPRKRART